MWLKREGAACLFSVGNSSTKSSLCLTPIPHFCYGLVHEGVHGSLVPNSHQALKQHGFSAVTKWPWEISSNEWGKKPPPSSAAPSKDVQCLLTPVWDISWELTQEGGYLLLYDFTAFRSHWVFLERLTSTQPSVLGRQNGEDHWANYLLAEIDQYDTLWVETSLKHALFRWIRGKFKTKQHSRDKAGISFFNSVYNAEISSSSRTLISHWIAYRNSYSYLIVYKVQSRQSRRRVGFENGLESYKAELPLFWRGRWPWATQVFCEDPVLSDFCREIHKLHERLGLVFPSPSIPIKDLIHYSLNKSCPCNVSHSLLEDHQNSVQASRTLKKAK